ncbi:hypothetical protein [Nonomuraea sp. NPDC050783]|uniref:hypothetical protein n=1 Tax=Nonomuraea sp. NPDC050783 TaxID=3154634 RepID=UPI0034672888
MITKALGLALAAAVLPSIPASSTSLHDCANATTRCDGSVDVPLDWENFSSERISVAFAWIPAKDADGTVVADLGGPGQTLPTVPEMQRVLGPVAASTGVVYEFDLVTGVAS